MRKKVKRRLAGVLAAVMLLEACSVSVFGAELQRTEQSYIFYDEEGLEDAEERRETKKVSESEAELEVKTQKARVSEAEPEVKTQKARVSEAEPEGKTQKASESEAEPEGKTQKASESEAEPEGKTQKASESEAELDGETKKSGISALEQERKAEKASSSELTKEEKTDKKASPSELWDEEKAAEIAGEATPSELTADLSAVAWYNPNAGLEQSWSVSGNQLTVTITGNYNTKYEPLNGNAQRAHIWPVLCFNGSYAYQSYTDDSSRDTKNTVYSTHGALGYEYRKWYSWSSKNEDWKCYDNDPSQRYFSYDAVRLDPFGKTSDSPMELVTDYDIATADNVVTELEDLVSSDNYRTPCFAQYWYTQAGNATDEAGWKADGSRGNYGYSYILYRSGGQVPADRESVGEKVKLFDALSIRTDFGTKSSGSDCTTTFVFTNPHPQMSGISLVVQYYDQFVGENTECPAVDTDNYWASTLGESCAGNFMAGAAQAHTHDYSRMTVLDATCTSAGSRKGSCSFCRKQVNEVIPAAGHSYGGWTVTKEATCTENGSRKRVCLRDASHQQTETVPAKGHVSPERYDTAKQDGFYYKCCTVCHAQLEKKANPYQIVFHKNGATDGTMSPLSMTYGTEKRLMVNAYTRDYPVYVFDGWNTKADGSGIAYSDQEVVNNLTKKYNDTVILYAQWRLNQCTLNYDVNGGDSTHEAYPVICTQPIGAEALPEAERQGYTFLGWSTGRERPDLLCSSLDTFQTVSQTLYAQWKPKAYPIRLDPAGGTLDETQLMAYYEQPIGSLPEPQKTGECFTGWVNQAKEREDRIPVTEATVMTSMGMTLTATYSLNTVAICFDSNGGTPESIAPYSRSYQQPYGELPLVTREGYVCKGWYTERSGGNRITESSLCPATDQTLYAQWKAASYTVSFDANGGEGYLLSQTMSCGEHRDLRKNKYTRSYYTFVGWNTEADGSGTTYLDEENVTNLTLLDGETVTLYAQWKQSSARCFFYDWDNRELGSLEIELGNPAVYYPEPSREGYRFIGWSGLNGALPESISEPWTYRAEYEAKSCSACFLDGTVSVGTIEKSCGEILDQLPVLQKAGYTFTGWNTRADGSGIWITADSQMPAAGLTCYAQFTANQYQLTFDYLGGTKGLESKTVACGSKLGKLPVSEKMGFVFQGWNTKADGSGERITEAARMWAEDKTLYAVWSDLYLTCIFKDDTGKILETQQVKYGEAAQPKIPQKTGYVFVGWDKPLSGITEDAAFIAAFRPITYTIVLAVNQEMYPQAEGTPVLIPAVYDEIQQLPKANYQISEVPFLGWTQEKDGSGHQIAEQAGVNNLTVEDGAVVLLYAQFRRHSYQVVFCSNGGNGRMDKQTLIYGSRENLKPNAFVREGYRFDGWNTEKDGSGDIYADKAEVLNLSVSSGEQIPLYAMWTLIYEEKGDGLHVRPGADGVFGSADDAVWWNGSDGIAGSADDKQIWNGADGIFGTADDYIWEDEVNGIRRMVGADGMFGTADDYIWEDEVNGIYRTAGIDGLFQTADDFWWWIGKDGKPETADDERYRFSASGGGSSTSSSSSSSSSFASRFSQTSAGPSLPEYVRTDGEWVQQEDGRWKYACKTGFLAGEWGAIYNPYADPLKGQNCFDWFCFDAEGYMITGWYLDQDGQYYYLWPEADGSRGHMVIGWKWIDEYCYYFNENSDGKKGALYQNAVTPDGYMVNEAGVWIENGCVQRKQ